MTPTPEKLAKLPKWAQEQIKSLSREVEMWKGAAARFAKEQPESPFYIESYGDEPKQFITTPMNTIRFCHAGVKGEVFLTRPDDGQRPYGIEIRFDPVKVERGFCSIAVLPRGIGIIDLVHKENMR